MIKDTEKLNTPLADSNWEEEKIKIEISIFFSKISEYLPKSLARSALGDEKICQAFSQAYREFRPVLLQQERQREREKWIDKINNFSIMKGSIIDKLEETKEEYRITNLLNENLETGYKQALLDVLELLSSNKPSNE